MMILEWFWRWLWWWFGNGFGIVLRMILVMVLGRFWIGRLFLMIRGWFGGGDLLMILWFLDDEDFGMILVGWFWNGLGILIWFADEFGMILGWFGLDFLLISWWFGTFLKNDDSRARKVLARLDSAWRRSGDWLESDRLGMIQLGSEWICLADLDPLHVID